MTTIKLKNGSGAPTAGDLVQGEPALDLTNKRLYTEDSGGTVIEVGTNPTSVTTGVITARVSGAGSTVEAFSAYNTDGGSNNSQVRFYLGASEYNTAGRGLRIDAGRDSGADGIATFYSVDQAEHSDYEAIKILTDGGVTLSHLGNNKLATTSTGIDVTGTVTADGLTLGSEGDQINIPTSAGFSGVITTGDTVFGNAFEFKNGNGIVLVSDTNDSGATGGVDATLIARGSSATKTALFDANGDISFYEDTGTTAKFFWDASAESLGIGTSSPARALHISTSADRIAKFESTDAGAFIVLEDSNSTSDYNRIGVTTHDMQFITNNSEAMRIDSSGNVGISTSSPSSLQAGAENLVVGSGSGDEGITIYSGNTSRGNIYFADGTTSSDPYRGQINYFHDSDYLRFVTAATERMRIDSDGRLLIGKTSADTGVVGIQTRNDGLIACTRDGDLAGIFNRKTSDGSIVEFRKDNSTVGSIGVHSGSITIGDTDTGLYFNDAYDRILPFSLNSSAGRDNAIDLGASTDRFKNLYLSGDTYLSNGSNLKFKDSGGTSRDILTFDSSNDIVYAPAGAGVNNHIWKRNGSEYMRLDTSGNLLVGTTTTGPSAQSGVAIAGGATSSDVYIRHANGTSSGAVYAAFIYNTSQIGSITQSGTTAVLYNTSSDQRLKENIVDAPSASDDIDAIQVRSFDWKADGSHQKYGMVAQELQSVAPEAVSGDADSDDMMGVDYSKLVPMMLKEIQSLRARVAQLEGAN